MKVLILPNFDKPGSKDCARRIVEKLLALDITPMMTHKCAGIVGIPESAQECVVAPFEGLLAGSDLILTIGGDGTILRAVQLSLKSGKPLLGVNTGRIGFLTQIEADELEKLTALRDGNYTMHTPMLLEAKIVQDGKEETFVALNEAVLGRGEPERLVEVAVTRGGKPVASHRGDGLIFSTPTGSTAYNLAAGGPVVDPSLRLIMMTAICPHSHFHNTIILSPEQSYKALEIPGNNKGGMLLSVDGRRAGVLRQGGHVLITGSAAKVPFVDLGLIDFYRRVDLKLKVGS
ncbi:MAG: NAD(+)/NADH kinase [Oscillospiraceae bacterium]|nr:NAD(+)/NADH kinase [Oscillospiraceae bacterium]